MNHSHINIWMQLLGFDRDDADRGVARFLDQIGFLPESVCALIFHPDFVHLHRGMDEEYELLRANCAYYGIPRNKERARQRWTNHDLRTLIAELKARGVPFYAGIMGIYLHDMYHHEWLSDHPEVRGCKTMGDGNLCCLKRLSDGSYYEDFFIRKLCEVLVDYDCAGIHLSDGFCPTSRPFVSDYSTDMCEQFLDHTGLSFPEAVAATMGEDGMEARNARADYIHEHLYEAWLRFFEWRWAGFFRKLCAAVHALGKQVHILGMYCTDPFETRFLYGFDMRRVIDAGVDCITANILPTSVSLNAPNYPYFFHRIHLDLPLVRAQVPEARIPSMLGVQDASEEWSVLDHRPTLLERDLYTMSSFLGKGPLGNEPAADGFFFCLSDGIPSDKWAFLRERVALATDFVAEGSHSPLIFWSANETDRMMGEFIRTRRTSCHKQATEIFQSGTNFGGAIRADGLGNTHAPIFAPNVDLLSDEERKALMAYGHPWVGTAPVGYDVSAFAPTYVCADAHSDYPMQAFVCGMALDEEQTARLAALLEEDDGRESQASVPLDDCNPLYKVLPFAKLSSGFIKVCGELLKAAMLQEFPVSCDVPMTALSLTNGRHRLYLYNPDENHYGHAAVTSALPIEAADVVSAYPVLPVRYLTEVKPLDPPGGNRFAFDHEKALDRPHAFRVKLAPGGVTVVEVTLCRG